MRGLVVMILALSLLATACFGRGNHYARYQHEKTAIRAIDTLLATIPQYPGAHVASRQDSPTSYHVPEGYIDAEPYSSDIHYQLARPVPGAVIQRYFRRVLHSRGWSCRFQKRTRGVPYAFSCLRRMSSFGAYIADHGDYELYVAASQKRPPITTVPGD